MSEGTATTFSYNATPPRAFSDLSAGESCACDMNTVDNSDPLNGI